MEAFSIFWEFFASALSSEKYPNAGNMDFLATAIGLNIATSFWKASSVDYKTKVEKLRSKFTNVLLDLEDTSQSFPEGSENAKWITTFVIKVSAFFFSAPAWILKKIQYFCSPFEKQYNNIATVTTFIGLWFLYLGNNSPCHLLFVFPLVFYFCFIILPVVMTNFILRLIGFGYLCFTNALVKFIEKIGMPGIDEEGKSKFRGRDGKIIFTLPKEEEEKRSLHDVVSGLKIEQVE